MTFDWPLSVGGDWLWGTATLDIAGRGRIELVINDGKAPHEQGYEPPNEDPPIVPGCVGDKVETCAAIVTAL